MAERNAGFFGEQHLQEGLPRAGGRGPSAGDKRLSSLSRWHSSFLVVGTGLPKARSWTGPSCQRAGRRPLESDGLHARRAGQKLQTPAAIRAPARHGLKTARASLDQLEPLETRVAVASDNNVVVHRNAQWLCDLDYCARHFNIGA